MSITRASLITLLQVIVFTVVTASVSASPHDVSCSCEHRYPQPKAECSNAGCTMNPQYGVVYSLYCFGTSSQPERDCIPGPTQDWLRGLPLVKFISSTAGVSRAGKSYLNNQLVNYIMNLYPKVDVAQATAIGLLKFPIDRFVTSPSEQPETKGIQLMALPRFRDGRLVPDECYIIIDIEGLELGDPINHRILLGIMSRLGGHLTFVGKGGLDDRVFAHLGQLLGASALLNSDPTSIHTSIPLPDLAIVISKYSNRPFSSDQAAMSLMREELEKTSGCAYIPERKLLLNQWLNRQRLDFFTIPFHADLLENDSMAPDSVAAATQRWIESVLHRIVPFPLPHTGQGFVDFCHFLLKAYRKYDLGEVADVSALEATIQADLERTIAQLIVQYEEKIIEHKLQPGVDEVDGARGIFVDEQAAAVKAAIKMSHANLVNEQVTILDTLSKRNRGFQCDHLLDSALKTLRDRLQAKEEELIRHWEHMHSINPEYERQEVKTQDSNFRTEVIGLGGRRYGLFGPRDRITANFVDRSTLVRTIKHRYNGDEVLSDWRVVNVSVVRV